MTMFAVLKELEKVNEENLLMKLVHHLESQAKPQTPKCSPEYYQHLADECYCLSRIIAQAVKE